MELEEDAEFCQHLWSVNEPNNSQSGNYNDSVHKVGNCDHSQNVEYKNLFACNCFSDDILNDCEKCFLNYDKVLDNNYCYNINSKNEDGVNEISDYTLHKEQLKDSKLKKIYNNVAKNPISSNDCCKYVIHPVTKVLMIIKDKSENLDNAKKNCSS